MASGWRLWSKSPPRFKQCDCLKASRWKWGCGPTTRRRLGCRHQRVSQRSKIALLAGVSVEIAKGAGAVIARIPMGADAFVKAHVFPVVERKAAEGLTCLQACLLDKQAVMLIATNTMA